MHIETETVRIFLQRLNVFVRHWAKEIIVALILAIAAAILIDPYLEAHKEHNAVELIKATSGAVAVVMVYDKNHEQISLGSGFFVTDDGKLVTNYHVIDHPGVSEIRAQIPSTHAVYIAKGIISGNRADDIAILQFDAKNTPFVKRGDSSVLKAGQKVIAIGAPLGLDNTVSEGVISNTERLFRDRKLIQFTAPISPGNSGGGLFDKQGLVIGVPSESIPGTKEQPGQNLNFAIPINLVSDIIAAKQTSLPTDQASNLYLQGQLESARRNYDKALDYYKRAIKLNGQFAPAYAGAANAIYEQGKTQQDFKLEVEYLKKAVELEPDNHEAIYMLGNAYEDVGQYREAIKMYKLALEIKPDDKNSLFYLAFLSTLMGDIKTAREAGESLMKLDEGIGKEIQALIKLASH